MCEGKEDCGGLNITDAFRAVAISFDAHETLVLDSLVLGTCARRKASVQA